METVPRQEDLEIETDNIREAVRVFRTITNKKRLRILQTLHRNGKMVVRFLCEETGMVQPDGSATLASLRKAGLVATEKCWGKYYKVNYDRLKELRDVSEALLKFELVEEDIS
jgi:predicted transcriptional regulator